LGLFFAINTHTHTHTHTHYFLKFFGWEDALLMLNLNMFIYSDLFMNLWMINNVITQFSFLS